LGSKADQEETTVTGNDILADAEAIVEGAATKHTIAQAEVVQVFGLTEEQATRAILHYEEEIERQAAVFGMPLALYAKLVPGYRAWGILGFYAGAVATADHIHTNHAGE
jgi:hypothetical protein